MKLINYSTSSYTTTSIKAFAIGCWLLLSLFITQPVAAYTTNMNASVVIGQENFTNTNSNFNAGDSGPVSGRGINNPMGLVSNGTNLIISDSGNHRVLIFNQIPTKDGVSADVVIGQENLQGGSADQGGSAAANTLDTPRGVIMAGNKLLIADRANNRVLLWNSIPTQNNARADVVIGQPDMTTVSSGTSSTKMNQPAGLYYDEDTGKLFISEWGNDRILIYNRLPTASGAEANVVIGQTNFTSNGTGTTAAKFNNPTGLKVIGGKLYIADLSNNRILVWNSIPTSNGVSADIAVGQTNLTSVDADQGLADPTAHTLQSPEDIKFDGTKLYVSDAANNRTLIYNSLPTGNNHAANIVLGQANFISDDTNQGGNAGANTISGVRGLFIVGNKLIVGDATNDRVLIFDNIINTPKPLFTSSPYQIEGGRVRFEGEVSLSGGTHSIWKIEASVNGGPFGNVTSLWDTTRTNPGIPDDKIAKFYHDIEPWENNNSTKEAWTETKDGYTVRFKAYSTNADTADPFFYFTPFSLLPPTSPITPTSPIPLKFQVNPGQQQLLKDNLDHYEVHIKPTANSSTANNQWKKYIDQIPISYDQVRYKEDNLLKDLEKITSVGDNGTYENGNLKVTYTNDSASIQVTSKTSAWNPALTPGTYQLKVVAVDKYGHGQETLPQELTIPKPLPYTVNPNKPRVKGVSTIQKGVSLPEQGDSLQKLPRDIPSPAPRPSPSNTPTNSNPILNFFEALFH